MRRATLAGAFVSAFAFALVATPAHGEGVEIEVSLRLGYVLGRGFTVGPGVSLFRVAVPGQFLREKQIAILGGLAASGDVVIGRGAAVDLRLHVGPEIGAVTSCTSIGGTLSGGALWVFRRGVPARFGFDAGASALVAVLGGDGEPRPLLVGAGYRYALAAREPSHEVILDVRSWAPRFDLPPYEWSGLCGVLSATPGGKGTPVQALPL